MYVIIEGIDTTGKSTLVDSLAKLPNVVATKEPGGTPLGQEIRKMIMNQDLPKTHLAEVFLFLADRANHYEEVVKPDRDTKIVVSDRGYISGISYAWANHVLGLDELVKLNAVALQDAKPDRVVLLKTAPSLLEERLGAKVVDGIESRGDQYLMWVQKCMERTLKHLRIPTTYIEVEGKTREEIFEEVGKIILEG